MKLVVTKPELLPEDVYAVRLVAVEPVQGNYGEQLRWKFEVTNGERKGAHLTAWSNLSTALNSKTLRWASVLAGTNFAPGDEVDLDKLIGGQCRAVVQMKTATDGRSYNVVTDLLPPRRVQVEVRKKHGMVAVPASSQGFYEMADDEDPDDPFFEEAV